jgi:glutamine amidotransferase
VIAIVDYKAGNLASVRKAFAALGAETLVAGEAREMAGVAGVVVPGVGHFSATSALDQAWRDALLNHVNAGRPLLGICLGMQFLFEGSEEAPPCPGLGLFQGTCRRLAGGPGVKVPHVGWNTLCTTRPSAALEGLPTPTHVYFTHSYAAPVGEGCVAVATHGERFAAVVERGNVMGAQFHPEKSGAAGLQVLGNFLRRVRAEG